MSDFRVAHRGAEGFGDIGCSGEAVDADGEVADGCHDVGPDPCLGLGLG